MLPLLLNTPICACIYCVACCWLDAKAVKRQELRNGDTIEVGKYKIRFLQDADAQNFEKTMVFKPGMAPALNAAARPGGVVAPPAPMNAVIRVLSGAAAGREVALHKVVTTIGKPGVAVASITKRIQGFVLAHVEGPDMPLLNGVAIGSSPVPLKSGDKLELAGTEMQFEQT